ncbi:MAG TPA: ABC transporter substrate-binding protein [Actinomycetota bacterium]|nr:ABC transporter substrate-binding protein [Actinomycetota bacterium]
MLITVLVATIALVAASCGKSTPTTSGASTPSTSSTKAPVFATPTGTKTTGGTVTFAEAPGAVPTYIFPLAPIKYFSTTNLSYFQPLLYRPLYWFGNNYNASVDYDYSIGQQPVWSADDKTVTITLNPYKWADGETVTARDVVFFMNLLEQEKANFADYTPSYFPDNVASYSAPNDTTVVFNLTSPQDPSWFLYNELSQITPFPLAWDVTAAGQPAPTADNGHLPDSTPAGAKAVYTYLTTLAANTADYVTSPTWQVVDGPWKLSAFTNTGEADFVPNPSYSGPNKPVIDKFVEEPFTSEAAEVNVTKTGANNLTIGYIPAASVPQESSILAQGYTAYDLYTFSFNYFVLNQQNPTLGPTFRQLYFRQAMQSLVDQQGWINAFTHGTAIAQNGVIPTEPANPFLSPAGKTFPYPFSVSKASSLLSSHGWKVTPNGVTTCTNPGTGANQCGAGVTAGTALTFNLDYQAGPVDLDQEMKDLKSEASKVGITLNLTTHPFGQVVGAATVCKATDTNGDCNWTAENWGGGWVYSPDFYPSGESIFATGAGSNQENYSDPMADQLILATTNAPGDQAQSALDAYQDYMQQQLPVIFQPNEAGNPVPGGLTIVSKKLGGFSANAFAYLTPETYYLTQ